MAHHPRALALLAQIARGLLRHGNEYTTIHLGDRSAYVGLSDVGRAVTCPRAAVASKLGRGDVVTGSDVARWLQEGTQQPIVDALGRQLVLQRGHWLEAGVETALRANGVNLIPQLEISIVDSGVPIRGHLDFVLAWGGNRPAVRVLELKSTEHLPQTLYPAYEAQLYGQIGLLKTYWDQPVFSLKDQQGTLLLDCKTFPQVCHHLFGIAVPKSPTVVEIEGWVLCLSMSEARAFGPYRPDAGMLALCRRTAESIWTAAQAVRAGQLDLNDVETCSGFHPLCAFCDHADGCPKFTADLVNDPALDQALAELSDMKADRATLDADIDAREAQIRQFCRHTGNPTAWLETPRFRFKTTRVPGRKTLDPASIRSELTSRIGEVDAVALLARATTIGEEYERLSISPLKSPLHEEPLP